MLSSPGSSGVRRTGAVGAVVKDDRIVWAGVRFRRPRNLDARHAGGQLPVVLDDQDRNRHGRDAARPRPARPRRRGGRVFPGLQGRVAAGWLRPSPEPRSDHEPRADPMGNARRRPAPDRRALRGAPAGETPWLKSTLASAPATPTSATWRSERLMASLGRGVRSTCATTSSFRSGWIAPASPYRRGSNGRPATSRCGTAHPALEDRTAWGIVGPRQGRYASFNSFYVKGAAYGGLVGGVAEAAVRAPPGRRRVEGKRLLSEASVAEMRRAVPREEAGLRAGSTRATRRGRFFAEHLGGGAGFWNVMPRAGPGRPPPLRILRFPLSK